MNNDKLRFGFGKNWEDYVKTHFSEERVRISQHHILTFLELPDLKGKCFLDVGCGSGLHSLAALKSGASKIVSFDYDPKSVSTTRMLKEYAQNPDCWEVKQGSILDTQFIHTLEPADIVYAWGVLHHTGNMWKAIENTSRLVRKDGLFYLALYTAGVMPPSDDFWLDVKQRYNRGGWIAKRTMELWYIWHFMLGKNPRRIPELIRRNSNYKKERGMALYTDIVDWLGGWPMEFAAVEQVKDFCAQKLGMKLSKIKTGEANTEYLFIR
jgi:2-polyprenyl-6-hydroxyphenyl methylase/3-demethylubiquinone-9 3-methyltransferase